MEEIESLKKEVQTLKDAIERVDYALNIEHDGVSAYGSIGAFWTRYDINEKYDIEGNNKKYFIDCYKHIIERDGFGSLDDYIKCNDYEKIKRYIDKIPILKQKNEKRGHYLHNKYKDDVILKIMEENNKFYDDKLVELRNIKQIPKKSYWFIQNFI